MKDDLLTINFFEGEHSIAYKSLLEFNYPWEAVSKIGEIVRTLARNLGDDFEEIAEGVYVFTGVKVPKSAHISPPTIICEGAEIRHGAYIRGNVIIGKGAVVGNSCEIKNSILFDGACVPHFSYVGDSIIGYKSHLGAGAIISNLKGDKSNVSIKRNGKTIATVGRKLGAILGDGVEVGAGSILNPGTVVFSGARIYPLSSVRGTIERDVIYKSKENIIKQKRGN